MKGRAPQIVDRHRSFTRNPRITPGAPRDSARRDRPNGAAPTEQLSVLLRRQLVIRFVVLRSRMANGLKDNDGLVRCW
ncbi:hypothetical protein U9M48_017003 [Paspalum notatum var. saurae]|uniref:Uncharacterized protein n=1 Tax=Paspalum notatum var. saurae TaxID=547442 RepID=A0AAQ3T7X2_PASNO